jgi:hypothetical protein
MNVNTIATDIDASYLPGGVSYPVATDRHVWNVFRDMTDRKNPIDRDGKYPPGPCDSWVDLPKGRVPFFYFDMLDDSGGHGGMRMQSHRVDVDPHMSTPSEVRAFFDAHCKMSSADVIAFRLSAWNHFHTQIPTEVSVANFLIELKDFEHIAKALKKGPRVKHYLNKVKALRPKDIPSIANSGFLNYNFAWAPFVGDLIKFTQVIDSVSRRLQYLRKTRGVPTRVHYGSSDAFQNSFVGNHDVLETQGPYSNFEYDRSYSERRLTLEGTRTQVSASGVLLQNLQGLDDAWAGLRATLASLGLNNPAKIAWNALPFSFMVDWIAPVGTFLERLAVQPFSGDWEVYDVCNSIKTTATIKEDFYHVPRYGFSPQLTTMAKHEVSWYHRELGLSLSYDDVGFTSLSTNQQMLFLSLIAGNTIFRKRGH